MPGEALVTGAANHTLAIEELVAGYGPVPIVRGVSMHTQASRLVALIGPNGAGKSTLLKAVMGLLTPTSGGVHLDGKALAGLRPEQIVRAGVGYVPQVGDVFDQMTVVENLLVGGIPSRATRDQRLEEVLDLFPLLRDRMKQRARTLSGGERRVLAIGRALMASPRVVLLDEPSAGLSPRAMGIVWEHLALLRERSIALLVVEQKAKAIMAIADWVYVLVDGKNVLEASGSDLGRIFMGQQITL
jgi:ABC-type branched-subunit amino acid transport system ATPase component